MASRLLSHVSVLVFLPLFVLFCASPVEVEALFFVRWWKKFLTPRPPPQKLQFSPAKEVIRKLRQVSNPGLALDKKGLYPGKKFLGIHCRTLSPIAKRACANPDISVADAWAMLDSPFNEQRWVAVSLLVHRFKQAGKVLQDASDRLPEEVAAARDLRAHIASEFVRHIPSKINHWKLVDLGSLPILGESAVTTGEAGRDLLYRLAKSKVALKRRAAIRATQSLVKKRKFKDVEAITRLFFVDPEHQLRFLAATLLLEAGPSNKKFLMGFLERHAAAMPRAFLSRAMSKLPLDFQERINLIPPDLPPNFQRMLTRMDQQHAKRSA